MTSTTRFTMIMGAALFSLGLAACSETPSRESIGTVGGAIVGGAAGSAISGGSTAGTVGGAAAGAIIGNKIGEDMDKDRGARVCTRGSATYANGSSSCLDGYRYRCNDGRWEGGNQAC